MISTVLHLMEVQGGSRLGVWAGWAHLVVMALLVLAWLRPVGALLLRRRARAAESWAPTWICPSCGHANAATRLSCEACHDGPGLLSQVRESPGYQHVERTARLVGLSARVAGWVIFYSTTILAAHRFRFFSFQQQPLREWLASAGMVLLLAALFYAERAMVWRWVSLFGRLTDSLASLFFAGIFLGVWVLWAAAPALPGHALAALAVTPDGVARILSARDRRIRVPLDEGTGALMVPVTFARLTWPPLDVDHTYVVRVGTQPVVTWLGSRLTQKLAGRWVSDDPHHPRINLLTQTLSFTPPGYYDIVRSRRGDGLAARPRMPAGGGPIP